MVGLARLGWKLLEAGILCMTGKTIDDVVPLVGRLKEDSQSGMGLKSHSFGTESLGKKAVKDGSSLMTGVRWELGKPCTKIQAST